MLLALTTGDLEYAGLALLVAIVGFVLDRRGREIKLIVNGRYDNLLARTAQLERTLRELGHEPPPDPAVALPPTTEER